MAHLPRFLFALAYYAPRDAVEPGAVNSVSRPRFAVVALAKPSPNRAHRRGAQARHDHFLLTDARKLCALRTGRGASLQTPTKL
jgi:hypothetical protein